MTDEEIERHILGLEKVRNVMEGFDREYGIDKIRRMIQEVRNEDKKEEPEDEEYESDSSETQRMKRLQWIRDNRKPKNWKRPQNYLKKNYLYIVRGCYLLIKTVDVVRKKWLIQRLYWTTFFLLEFVMRYVITITVLNVRTRMTTQIHRFQLSFWLLSRKELTRVEKQIYFFQTRMDKSPIYLSNTNRTNVRAMKREMDVLMDTYNRKVEFQKDKIYLQAIKSYVKNHWKSTYLSHSKELSRPQSNHP